MDDLLGVLGAHGFFRPVAGSPVPAPAIILMPAIAGINDYIHRRAIRLNELGYAVLSPDYHDEAPDLSSPEKIRVAVASVSDNGTMETVARAVGYLRDRSDVNGARVGIAGFCIGGTYAYMAACRVGGLRAAVGYYGRPAYNETSEMKPVSPIEMAGELKTPFLGHFGTADHTISVDAFHAFEQALLDGGKPHELRLYRGAPHAFDEDFRPSYRPAAAAEAWRHTRAFLDWHLCGRLHMD